MLNEASKWIMEQYNLLNDGVTPFSSPRKLKKDSRQVLSYLDRKGMQPSTEGVWEGQIGNLNHSTDQQPSFPILTQQVSNEALSPTTEGKL